MHVKISTSSIDAYDILKKFCVENSVKYDSIIFGDQCTVTVKEPDESALTAIARFVKSMNSMVDIRATVYVDKASQPVNIEDLDI